MLNQQSTYTGIRLADKAFYTRETQCASNDRRHWESKIGVTQSEEEETQCEKFS